MAAIPSEPNSINNNEPLPPIHPGELLRVWLQQNPIERIAEITEKTEMSATEFVNITECKAPFDEKTALALSPVFGPAAEFWYRMWFAYNQYQETGHEPAVEELPVLSRRVPEAVPA